MITVLGDSRPCSPLPMHDLDPLDPDYVRDVLSKPPFVPLHGVINVRDLGHYPSTTEKGQITKPGYLFRAAELSSITDEGTTTVTY